MNCYIFFDSRRFPVSKFFQRLYFNQFIYKIQVVYQKILEKPAIWGSFLNIAQFIIKQNCFFGNLFNTSLAVSAKVE